MSKSLRSTSKTNLPAAHAFRLLRRPLTWALLPAVTVSVVAVVLIAQPTEPSQAATGANDPLSPAVLTKLEANGITLEQPNGPASVSSKEALRVAASELPTFGSRQVSSSLVTMTDATYGKESGDPGGASEISPTVVGRLAWAITYQHASIPVFGGRDMESGGGVDSTLVLFIDAQTGVYIEAISVQS